MPKKKIETIVVTPELAVELLDHNHLNRPLRDQHVQRIARQITDGKWKFNGDTIKVASSGDVLDGQHRLWAVIEAKKPIETIIVYGIEREAFATIDTLRAVRSGADVVALNGGARYRTIISSALTWLIRWQGGHLDKFKDPTNKVENSDIEAAYTENPDIVAAVERAVRLRGIGNPALIAFLFYIFTNRNQELAERLIETLRNPVGVPLSDPFFVLRSYFLADHHKRKEPLITIALTIKAANAAYRNQKVKVLSWKNQGKIAEPFPVLSIG